MKYYGIDIVDCSKLVYNKNKITLHQCDQGSKDDMNQFINKYNLYNKIDVVIDDGSHMMSDILNSLYVLYPNLKKGGLYFIEDIHAGQAQYNELIVKIKEYLTIFDHQKMDIYNNKLIMISK